MDKKLRMLLILLFVLFLSACSSNHELENSKLGSFTLSATSSFDGKYIADISTNEYMVAIQIVDSEKNDIFYFEPVRKRDFWGVCWENDTYNLWIQSGDVGVICYQFDDGVWIYNPDATRPEYILSKYD